MTKPFSSAWNRYNCVGRLFMMAVYVMSFCGMGSFSYYTFQRYISEPISITMDVEYINLSFPAVSICLVKGKGVQPLMPIIEKFNITLKGSKSNFLHFLQECMFANTLHSTTILLEGCDDLQSSYGFNVKEINDMFLPRDCHDFLDNIYYKDKLISNCSELFKPHKTELGNCFIANSIIDNDYSFNNLKLSFDFFTKSKILSMRLRNSRLWQYMLHVHSPGDVPFLFSIATEISNSAKLFSYNVDEIITDKDASRKSIQQRGCRFPEEKLDGMPFHYSFSNCMSFLRIQMELKECNCTHSVSPEQYRSLYCNFTGKMCLYNKGINKKVAYHAMMDKICMPVCREQIIKYCGQSEVGLKTETHSEIAFEVVDAHSALYMRSVTRTKLDLAVSVAGLAGLFFGASVLNLIEIFYHLFAVKK